MLHGGFPSCGSLILEQQGSQTPTQVPFQLPGQQAEKDMPSHVLFAVDKHGPDVEPGGFQGTKGALDSSEGHTL